MSRPLPPARSGRARRQWSQASLIVTATAFLVVGLVGGYLFGARTTCGEDCRFDVQVFEAIGTWAGALGTVGVAVVGGLVARGQRIAQKSAGDDREAARVSAEDDREAARIAAENDREAARKQAADDREAARIQADNERASVVEAGRERERRLAADLRAAEEARLLRKARSRALMCVVRASAVMGSDHKYEKLRLTFVNPLAKDAVHFPLLTFESGRQTGGEEQVWPQRSWAWIVPFAEIGLADSYPDAETAMRAYNDEVRDSLTFEFTLRGYRFSRRGKVLSEVEGGADPIGSP